VTENLWAALAEVQDPEMPVNLVDLGVIYGITERDGIVDVDLTFTAMGCPAHDFILEDIRERLLAEPEIEEVEIKVVWDPPWSSDRLTQEGRMGPAARLGATNGACVLRGPGKGVVTDGPFTETKEQLLGFYVIDCADRDAAIAAARDLRRANPSAMYEIRPVSLYRPGVPFPETEA